MNVLLPQVKRRGSGRMAHSLELLRRAFASYRRISLFGSYSLKCLEVKFSELRLLGFLGSSLGIDGLRLVDLAEEDRDLVGGKLKDVLYQPLAFRCG
jgi:hypothetical protein